MDLEQARKIYPPIWTIYNRPLDYPDKFVVRVWYGTSAEVETTTHDSLDDARESIIARGGSFGLIRSERDDPCIVESWI